MTKPTTIFVWDREHHELRSWHEWLWPPIYCRNCRGPLFVEETIGGGFRYYRNASCLSCGWALEILIDQEEWDDNGLYRPFLARFDINSTQLPMQQLGAHLKAHRADLYSLGWRRFEDLVADVFREHGYRVIQTLPSHDGGADLLLLKAEGAEPFAIVECKKYSFARKVGVGVVDRLAGATLRWNTRTAYLVTTSRFTRGARRSVGDLTKRGLEVNLIDFDSLARLLDIYSEGIAPIHDIVKGGRGALMNRTLRAFIQARRSTSLIPISTSISYRHRSLDLGLLEQLPLLGDPRWAEISRGRDPIGDRIRRARELVGL